MEAGAVPNLPTMKAGAVPNLPTMDAGAVPNLPTMEADALPNPGVKEEYRYKNRLQEFAQRASIPLPVYQTFSEGSQISPQFRSTVIVDGTTYVSPCASVRRREAEQLVAKFALESILMKIKQEGVSQIHNDVVFCKTILHEYAGKMKMELPKYTTSKSEGVLPAFFTTLVFDGKTFVGGAGRSKREAEQLGALTVIDWIIGQCDTCIYMAEIIKSKAKLFNAFRRDTGSIVSQDNSTPLKVPISNHPHDTIAKEKDMHAVSTNDMLPAAAAEHSVLSTIENPKERHICEVWSGSVGEGSAGPTLQQNNQPEGSTNGPLNSVSNASFPEQVVQVKKEVLSEGPQMLSDHLQNQNPNPGSSGKRSRSRSRKKQKKESNSKKIRTN